MMIEDLSGNNGHRDLSGSSSQALHISCTVCQRSGFQARQEVYFDQSKFVTVQVRYSPSWLRSKLVAVRLGPKAP